MITFAYYGAKNTHLSNILPLLPQTDHYVEPFCGSAAVLLNKKPSPIETINDLNGDIINFFKVLRDNPQPLIDALLLTPYSRQEFVQAWENTGDPVEDARRWYVKVQMDIAKAGARKDRSWSKNKTYNPGTHSSAVRNFMSKISGLEDVATRLRMVQIECMEANQIILKYDTKNTLFYCDPPYHSQARITKDDYRYEMNEVMYSVFAETINQVKGLVAISGYDSPKMNDLFKGLNKFKFKAKVLPMSTNKRSVSECLWTNYDPAVKTGQTKLSFS